MKKLSLVVPFYNEEKNARRVVGEVLTEFGAEVELIAVDNGSRDGTGVILDKLALEHKNVVKVRVPVNKGYGFGIRSGLKKATGDFVGYMWGDNQIAVKYVRDVYDDLVKNKYDLCKIKRVRREDGIVRKILSEGYNFLCWIFFGVKSKDINGCPKIMRKECYKKISPESNDWFIDCEIMIKAKRNGFAMHEVPAEFKKRDAGKSNVNFGTALGLWKNILRYRFKRA